MLFVVLLCSVRVYRVLVRGNLRWQGKCLISGTSSGKKAEPRVDRSLLSVFSAICCSFLALLLCLAAASSLPFIPSPPFIKGMTLPSISGVDPDPTTQMPWPGARKRSDRELDAGATTPPVNSNHASRRGSTVSRAEMNGKRRRLSTFDLFNLSISMAGAQIAWTVELG